jgi:PAS domain S-box-containing protein
MQTVSLGRLLIVDDETELAAALKEMLSAQGYETETFASGKEALETLKEKDFDLLLTDLMMPEIDGIALLQSALAIDPRLVGIVMTGQGTVQTAVDAMKVGAFDYILKPFKSNTLLPVISRAMDVRRLKLENMELRQTLGIYELGQTISYTLDLNAILDKVADGALQQCNADEASILLPTREGNELYVAAVRGEGREQLLGQLAPADKHIAGWVALHREPLVLRGRVEDPRFTPLAPRGDIQLAVSMPLMVGGKLAGILNLGFTKPRRNITLGELKALSILTAIAGSALESARLHTEVRIAEENYRSIFENAIEGIFQTSPGGERFITANTAMARILGYDSPEELMSNATGIGAESFSDPADHAKLMRMLETQNFLSDFECECKRRDGSSVWVSFNIHPAGEAGATVRGYEGTMENITERKRAAQRLLEQAALLDITADAIFVRDMRHDIIYWNKGAEKTFGWSASDAMGKNADDLLGTHAPDSMKAYEIILEKGEWTGEFHRKSKDGRELTIQARWTLVRDLAGKPRGILAVNTDVTEQRSIQQQLLRAQRLESVGTLAGGIAHDLNNILSPILMGIEGLSIQHSDESSRKILEIIKTATQRGANIVRQVLSFARGIEGEHAEVQLKHLIREMDELIKEAFPKTVEVRVQIPKDLLPVIGDATQLHQVLMNLCVNARDAMPEGGILTLSAENVELDETYARMHIEARPIRYVVLQVEDTGTGMAPGIVEKIFDPFFTTKEPGKGTGLGLSTAHSIVKSHGGFINVYSEVGKGSAFKVYIPAADQGALDRSEKVQEGIPMGEGELILIADDEAAVREITKQILEAYGYQVLLAKDGTEAVVHYAEKREEIRVVVTDMMMPFMDGAATIRALRKISPTVKIIATSGLATSGQAHEAAGLGVDSFLAKPYTAEALLGTLRKVLGAAQRSAPA